MQMEIAKLETLGDVGDILFFVRDFASKLGSKRHSYHFTPIFERQTSRRAVIHTHGFPLEWLELYQRADFRAHDPVPRRTFKCADLLTWRDAETYEPNTPEQDAYFTAMKAHGLEYGFGLPLYGPRARNAYASFDFGKPIDELEQTTIIQIRGVARAAHIKLCRLLEQEQDVPDLSDRELQVLSWIARGKSNTDIATILSLSPETVRTYAKRVYTKLGVYDRVGATVRGLKLGLVST